MGPNIEKKSIFWTKLELSIYYFTKKKQKSLKYAHFFPKNLGDLIDEHGERFHQEIKSMERRYQGFWNERMMGDYIWFLVRESDNENRRQSKNLNYF